MLPVQLNKEELLGKNNREFYTRTTLILEDFHLD